MTNKTPGWDLLSPDMTELILSNLPIPSIIRASSVCKAWNSIIHSRSFKIRVSNSTRFPWFFLLAQMNNQLLAFDPQSNVWMTKLPNKILNSMNSFCQTGPIKYSRCNSIEACLDAEINNPRIDSCPPLPEIFGPGNSSKLLCTAIFHEKLYVLGIYSSFISCFDMGKRFWSNVQTLRPPGVMFSYLISCKNELVLAGLCSINDDWDFILWRIDEKTLEFSEIGIMPRDLLSGFLSDSENLGRLKCVGSGNLVYVFDEKCPWNYPVCVCEISGSGKCSWKRIPNLPGNVNEIQKFVGFCSNVCLVDVLGNGKD